MRALLEFAYGGYATATFAALKEALVLKGARRPLVTLPYAGLSGCGSAPGMSELSAKTQRPGQSGRGSGKLATFHRAAGGLQGFVGDLQSKRLRSLNFFFCLLVHDLHLNVVS